ncbi:bicyclomycin/multidrug efflux system [Pelomyxa schiedti]|nr:bicyclomycin/multidrug efflux system [Pelomyxa schiedti]
MKASHHEGVNLDDLSSQPPGHDEEEQHLSPGTEGAVIAPTDGKNSHKSHRSSRSKQKKQEEKWGADGNAIAATLPPLTTKRKLTLFFLILEMTILTLSVMFIEVMLVPALSMIGTAYMEQIQWVPWVLSAYLITGGISTPMFSAMSTTKLGVKKTVATCLSFYIAGVIGCGLSFLSPNIVALILLRGLQGFGMGSFTLCFTIIKASFPPKIMGPTLGIVSSMFAVGSAVGLLGGGAALEGIHFTYDGENMSWATLFWITGPVVILIVIAFMITTEEPASLKARTQRRIDFIGGILLCFVIGTFLVGVTLGEQGWSDPTPIILLCLTPVFLVLFVLWEIRMKEDALFPTKLMLNRTVILMNLVALTTGYGMFALFQTLPFFLSDPDGPFKYTSTLDIGLILFPSSIPGLLVSPFTAMLSKKIGAANIISFAMLIMAVTFLLQIYFYETVAQIVLIQILSGVGIAGVMSLLVVVLSAAVELNYFATAAAVNTLFRISGGAIGPVISNIFILDDMNDYTPIYNVTNQSSTALTSSLSSVSTSSPAASSEWAGIKDYQTAWLIGCIVMLFGFLCSLFLPGQCKICGILYKKHHKHHHHHRQAGTSKSPSPDEGVPITDSKKHPDESSSLLS